MKNLRFAALLILASIFLCACGSSTHVPLGANNYGFSGREVKVVKDIKINSLQVRHISVEDARCTGGFWDHLELSGPIGPDSSEVVARVLESMPRCNQATGRGYFASPVFLNSSGGLLEHGYQLGKTFRKFSVKTHVLEGQTCASSCAIAFLGGLYRAMPGRGGQLIFHSPYWKSGASISCPSKEEAKDLNAYYNNFLSTKDSQFLFDRTMSFCSQSAGWSINADAAKLFGLTTN